MLRIFLLTGSYVDVRDMRPEDYETYVERAKTGEGPQVIPGIGKVGEILSIRVDATAYAARYKTD